MARVAKTETKIGTISAGQAARLLDLTHERLRQLAAEGFIPKAERGRYPLVGVVQGYIKFLNDEERRSARSKPDADLRAARQREVEMRNAEREARVIDYDDAVAFSSDFIRTAREVFAGVGEQATDDPAMAAIIDTHISGIISRAEQRFRAAHEAWRTGRDPFVMDADNDEDG